MLQSQQESEDSILESGEDNNYEALCVLFFSVAPTFYIDYSLVIDYSVIGIYKVIPYASIAVVSSIPLFISIYKLIRCFLSFKSFTISHISTRITEFMFWLCLFISFYLINFCLSRYPSPYFHPKMNLYLSLCFIPILSGTVFNILSQTCRLRSIYYRYLHTSTPQSHYLNRWYLEKKLIQITNTILLSIYIILQIISILYFTYSQFEHLTVVNPFSIQHILLFVSPLLLLAIYIFSIIILFIPIVLQFNENEIINVENVLNMMKKPNVLYYKNNIFSCHPSPISPHSVLSPLPSSPSPHGSSPSSPISPSISIHSEYPPLTSIHTSKSYDLQGNCYICETEQKDGVLLPCGHGGICYECALSLYKRKNHRLCPICRKSIKQILKIETKKHEIEDDCIIVHVL
ncbi:hypothetical protein WA158_002142 [Blastocystis sp. Blastoise]